MKSKQFNSIEEMNTYQVSARYFVVVVGNEIWERCKNESLADRYNKEYYSGGANVMKLSTALELGYK